MPKRTPNRSQPMAVQLRFTREEHRILKAEADANSLSITAFLRRISLGISKLTPSCKESLDTVRAPG